MADYPTELNECLGISNLDNFDWENDSWLLASRLSDYFFEWWSSEKYNWIRHGWALPMHCSEYFDYWYDPDKFFWSRHGHLLHKFCMADQETWGPDYVLNRISPDSRR